jgi:serine/threonine-protein kinase PpkA
MQKIPGYQIIRKIDQGGMSTVYLAVQLSVGREVALKVMSPALNSDPVFSERFQREANIVGQLTHPNIVRIYDIGRHNNLNYIAMDYLPGGTIHDKMAMGISLKEALRITREIAGALDHAHRKGYVHRDIKPENILFNEDNTAILSDFGVAKTVSSGSQMTNAGTVVGTPHYMSPEQARGKPIDGRSDLYSLGVVLYEMLTGSVPYKADEAVAIAIKHLTAPIPKLPSQYVLFQPLLNKLLAKEPEDRFQCGREIIDSLDNTQSQLSGHPTSYTTSTDSSTVQIFVLLKALLLTTYAALSSNVWRLLKLPVKKLGSTSINMDSSQQENYTTVVATRVNDAVVVTRNPYAKKRLPVLAVILLTALWLAGSSWLHSSKNPALNSLPAPIQTATKITSEQLGKLVSAFLPSKEKPQTQQTIASEAKTLNPSQPAAGPQASAKINTVSEVDTRPTELNERQVVPPKDVEPVKAEPPEPTEFALTIAASPSNARVRIMNIRDVYQPGIKLSPGSYDIRVSAKGYHTLDRTIEISDRDRKVKLQLTKAPIAGAVFYNTLKTGGKGPAMVIIPPGSFNMGDRSNANSAPVRKVRIRRAFAVSQYEITYADYRKFTDATGREFPQSRWGKGSRPVTNVSWHDAVAYSQWLRKTTGKKYRLLTEAEWEYTARAETSSDYWWGSKSANKKANCRRGCDSPYSNLINTKTAPVGSFRANKFKLYDTAGNVAEWVQDCYQDHYLGAPKDGSAVDSNHCSNRSIRGGSIRSSSSAIKSHSRDRQPSTKKASHIGFRVAVDLY